MLFFQLASTCVILILQKSYPFMIWSFRSVTFFMLHIENLFARADILSQGLL